MREPVTHATQANDALRERLIQTAKRDFRICESNAFFSAGRGANRGAWQLAIPPTLIGDVPWRGVCGCNYVLNADPSRDAKCSSGHSSQQTLSRHSCPPANIRSELR